MRNRFPLKSSAKLEKKGVGAVFFKVWCRGRGAGLEALYTATQGTLKVKKVDPSGCPFTQTS